jgi:hypothetical protein
LLARRNTGYEKRGPISVPQKNRSIRELSIASELDGRNTGAGLRAVIGRRCLVFL